MPAAQTYAPRQPIGLRQFCLGNWRPWGSLLLLRQVLFLGIVEESRSLQLIVQYFLDLGSVHQ